MKATDLLANGFLVQDGVRGWDNPFLNYYEAFSTIDFQNPELGSYWKIIDRVYRLEAVEGGLKFVLVEE
jgi:hypothetical protein